MEEEKAVLVGLDIADEYTQLCYFTEAGELFSVSLSKDSSKFRIPTVLAAFAGNSDWMYGEDAAGLVETPTCVKISGLATIACEDSNTVVFDQDYPADIILERFMRRLLNAFKAKTGVTKIAGMVVTSPRINDSFRKNVRSALDTLGVRDASLQMISHLESFMYYVVSQNKDIWINDVGLFDFGRDNFTFYRLSFGRRNTPITVVAEKQDITDKINFKMLAPEEADRLQFAFENTANSILFKQIISGLYFTGEGFESAWADDILKKLCNGRRIFRGQNLYVKGAGYAASLLFGKGENPYFFVNDEVLKSSISVRVMKDGEYSEMELAKIGQHCSDAGAEIEVIMDRTNELDFIVHNVLKKDFICAIMTLDTLVLRDDRTSRLNVRLRFPNRDTCVITVRDAGFGEIYKTNHKIWEQVLKI